MSIFDYFRSTFKASSASVAQERLQIIVSPERGQRQQPGYLPETQQEILDVITHDVLIDQESVKHKLENNTPCSKTAQKVSLMCPVP